MNSNEKITDKPRLLSEMASWYGVNVKTFKSWLKCKTLSNILDQKIGSYFSIAQVRRIVDHLGEPNR